MWSEEKPLNVLVNIQRMVHLFVAVDTVCKSSDALKIELISSLRTSWRANSNQLNFMKHVAGRIFFHSRKRVRHKRKTIRCNTSIGVCRP